MTLLFPNIVAPGDRVELCELQIALTTKPEVNSSGGSSGLSGGAIAGIVIGSLVGVTLLVLAVMYLRWRSRWLEQQRMQLEAVAPAGKDEEAAAGTWEAQHYGGGDEEEGSGPPNPQAAAPAAAAAAAAGAAKGGADGDTAAAAEAAWADAMGGGDAAPVAELPGRVSEFELIGQFIKTLRRGRITSLSQKSNEESRSRRRAGFHVVKGGAAGGGMDTDVVTDLTKLPPGFLEGACVCWGVWWAIGLEAGWLPGMRGVAWFQASLPARTLHNLTVYPLHPASSLPASHAPACRSLPRRHPAGGVRGGGFFWRGVAGRVLRRAGGGQDPGQGEGCVWGGAVSFGKRLTNVFCACCSMPRPACCLPLPSFRPARVFTPLHDLHLTPTVHTPTPPPLPAGQERLHDAQHAAAAGAAQPEEGGAAHVQAAPPQRWAGGRAGGVGAGRWASGWAPRTKPTHTRGPCTLA